jgi:predicted glycoside hydrolase/deacetylase ChbG (UPF0249 family)
MVQIINADDFGESKEINEAIILAFKQGTISSTSIIHGNEKDHAIKLVKKHNMPCGIHLRKDGLVYWIFLKSLFSKKFLRQLEEKFEKQIIDLKKDIELQHIDSHKHIHMFPPIFSIVLKLAKKHNLRLRLCKNIEISLLNRFGLSLFYPHNKKKAIKEKVLFIESYETHYKKLKELINNLEHGEIIVHPGTINEGRMKRKEELNILLKNKNE